MNILNKLTNIKVDKYLHFIVCLFLSFITSKLVTAFSTLLIGLSAGLLFAISVGIVKEMYDSHQKGNFFDKDDLKADIAGSIIGILMSI
jgi:Sec-independent protein secretion pathway component TatC